jgi:uncharacterized protein YbaA (DUF1428 family)
MDSPVQGVSFMRKSVFVLAVIGAACSSVAFAAEVKKDKAHIPAVKATTMSDADMDKVTAGSASKITSVFNGGNDNFIRFNNNNINCHNVSPCGL